MKTTTNAPSTGTTSSGPYGPSIPSSQQPLEDLATYVRNYARERPDVAALWCFGIGFVLGWKLKPW
jgi:hypothetical protein